MQFKPIVYNSNGKLDVLKVFDPNLLMFLSYTRSDIVEDEGNGV